MAKKRNIYILKTFFYKSFYKGYSLTIKIKENKFFCRLYEDIIYSNNKKPILKNFQCNKLIHANNNPIIDINQINRNLNKCILLDEAITPNQFIISKIYTEFINKKNFIIIKGKVFDDLKLDLYDLKILLIYPKKIVKCFIKSTNKIIQAYIYCNIGEKNYKKILISNQIIYSENCNGSLLLINKEIFYQNYQIINNRTRDQYILSFDYIIFIILLFYIFIKVKLKKL